MRLGNLANNGLSCQKLNSSGMVGDETENSHRASSLEISLSLTGERGVKTESKIISPSQISTKFPNFVW